MLETHPVEAVSLSQSSQPEIQKTFIGDGTYRIIYPKKICPLCNQPTKWQSVDGLCWDCTIIEAKEKAIMRIHADDNFNPFNSLTADDREVELGF